MNADEPTPVWRLAAEMGVVPLRPDLVLSTRLSAWWGHAITRGCQHSAGAVAWVVWPATTVWCGPCGLEALERETGCIYCTEDDVDGSGINVVVESAFGLVVLLGRAHTRCSEEATR